MRLTAKQRVILIFLNESFKKKKRKLLAMHKKQERFGKTMLEI